LALFVLITSTVSWPRLQERYTNAAEQDAEAVLRLVGDALDQTVKRYQHVPTLIADDPILLELLEASDNQGLVPFINEKLRLQAVTIGASDIYIMDTSGTTVATSNYRMERSFLGQNFAYRPYFQEAMAGEITQFHALGTTSGSRGFFFAAPVLNGIQVVGVMAVKVTVDDIENAWLQSSRRTIVADANGIAFLASQPEYRLRALAPLSVDTLTRIEQTQQFPIGGVTPLPLSSSVVRPGVVEVIIEENGGETRFLSNSAPLVLPGWHAIVLTPFEEVRSQVLNTLAIRLLIGTALILSAFILFQRWNNLLERMKTEKQMRDQLEIRVQERTADLNAANDTLRTEVQERKNAEQELRTTQTHLIQAGKLAALGQMSAALSHEINQPLGAMKSYADNALQYLERQRLDEVGDNIRTISEMTDRVAEISRNLRNFARRPGDTLTEIPVFACIGEAISIFEPQLRKTGAVVLFQPRTPEIWVLGGRLRLQQVLIGTEDRDFRENLR
jgi:two-component system C4-dicarboxylate transport sensor histidine kinase DctB